MKKQKMGLTAGVIAISITANGCGKKKSDDAETPPPYVGALALGSDAMNYGMKVLASSNKTSPSAALASMSPGDADLPTRLDSVQDPDLPDCSNNGEPWDKTTGQRMQTSNPKYSQTVFYCQVNSKQSPETLAGSLSQYKAILCDVERVVGSINYTEAGTEYKDKALSITEACGWSKNQIDQMSGQTMTANLTAYSMSSGDWQKRVHVTVPAAKFDFNIYFTIKNELVGFKFVETWDQAERMQGGDYNSNISNTTTGTRGSVVTIDTTNGILRAESVDTYWSRRFRFYIKGTLDSTTGIFTSVTDGQGIVATFDNQSGLYAEIATATGNDAAGFTYNAYQYSTTNVAAARTSTTVSTSASACSKTGGCAGQTAITFGADSADFDYLMIGAVWDAQAGKRSTIESWISAAGALNHTSVSKDVTL